MQENRLIEGIIGKCEGKSYIIGSINRIFNWGWSAKMYFWQKVFNFPHWMLPSKRLCTQYFSPNGGQFSSCSSFHLQFLILTAHAMQKSHFILHGEIESITYMVDKVVEGV